MDIVFGGTFNPPHCGHQRVIERLQDWLPNARIHLLPCWQPVHKAPTTVPVAIRRLWLEAFIEPWSNVFLDEREWLGHRASYTVDTLQAWRLELGPTAPLAFAIGSDSFAQFESWHRWSELFDLAHWLVLSRPDCPATPSTAVAERCAQRWCDPTEKARLLSQPAGCVVDVPGEPLAAASSDLRQQQSLASDLLPERVRVLWQHHLDQLTGFHS